MINRYSFVFLAALLAASFAVSCGGDRTGDVLQEFRLETLGGGRFYLGDHRGKAVVMVFWSVHCVPCHRQLSDLGKHGLMNDPKVKVVSVCVDPADRGLVEQGARMFGGGIPVLLDEDRAVARKLGVEAEPTTLIVDKKGTEASRIVGYDGATLSQITKAVAVIEQRTSR